MNDVVPVNNGYDGSNRRWKKRQIIDNDCIVVYVYKNNKRHLYKAVNLTCVGIGIVCVDNDAASLIYKDVVNLVIVVYGVNSDNIIGIYFKEGYVVHNTGGIVGLLMGNRKQ
ncbi:MAG: hypothetical protein ACRDFB_00490 [Rhabdochlamydiaceae bacterium]